MNGCASVKTESKAERVLIPYHLGQQALGNVEDSDSRQGFGSKRDSVTEGDCAGIVVVIGVTATVVEWSGYMAVGLRQSGGQTEPVPLFEDPDQEHLRRLYALVRNAREARVDP